MNDIQPYQFELEGTLEEEDDSVQNLNCILANSNVKCISQHPE